MPTPITYSDQDADAATRTLSGEARGETPVGEDAVPWVLRNRLSFAPSWWGRTIFDICHKKWQFSCWNGGADTDHITGLKQGDTEYATLLTMVKGVFEGAIPDPTGGSTMYKVRGTPASWDKATAGHPPRSIGHHDFWRMTPGGAVLPFTDEEV